MSDMISREAAIAVATSCPDSHWGPWIAERLRALSAVQPCADSFADLIADARLEAAKAMKKFPQPNYIISKVAEEAGEVVKAAIHCAEGRETAESVRGEIKQVIAMLYRLWVEGDQVHGLTPLDPALIDNPAVQPDAQCCMCGKKGLSTEENGGPECELHDGRWVCSENCWNDALEPSAAAIREAALVAALKECADDLESYVEHAYPIETRAKYPTQEDKYARDMEPVVKARALIDSPGKEVMPDVEDTHHARPDTAPAGLSAGGGAGWQPIETAPKDGIAFLGYWPDVADFGEADNACEVRTWWNETEQRYESCFETASSDSEPTHWMPRPAPPATDGGA